MKNLLIIAMLLTMTGCAQDGLINRVKDGHYHRPAQTQDDDNSTDYSKPQPMPGQNGTTVYDPSECVGTVVNGVCHGGIVPNQAVHPICHGEMINGQCTGPMF